MAVREGAQRVWCTVDEPDRLVRDGDVVRAEHLAFRRRIRIRRLRERVARFEEQPARGRGGPGRLIDALRPEVIDGLRLRSEVARTAAVASRLRIQIGGNLVLRGHLPRDPRGVILIGFPPLSRSVEVRRVERRAFRLVVEDAGHRALDADGFHAAEEPDLVLDDWTTERAPGVVDVREPVHGGQAARTQAVIQIVRLELLVGPEPLR